MLCVGQTSPLVGCASGVTDLSPEKGAHHSVAADAADTLSCWYRDSHSTAESACKHACLCCQHVWCFPPCIADTQLDDYMLTASPQRPVAKSLTVKPADITREVPAS